MSEKIIANWDASVPHGTHAFTLDDLNVASIDDWNALTHDAQQEAIQAAFDDISEQPNMIVCDWSAKI